MNNGQGRTAGVVSKATKNGNVKKPSVKNVTVAPNPKKKIAAKKTGASKQIGTSGASTDVTPYFSKLNAATQRAMKHALENVIRLGDTDVFPRSFETFLLSDSREQVLNLLGKTHAKFQEMLIAAPPVNDKVLAAVGYSGFRAVTQVDPIWNLYLLSLTILLGPEIEAARVSTEKGVVHSYRFKCKKDDPHIFDGDIGWFSFQERCEQLAKEHKFVLLTDISDFYPRIYHHRLENALKKVTANREMVKRIVRLLTEFSGGVSYGLPVGGPAARLLSELLLNSTDRLLLAEGVKFTRFVDDFRLFANSREEAYGLLVMLAQKIGESDGLSLQKSKTKIMSTEEYLSHFNVKSDETERASEDHTAYRNFMSLKLHFDPYSDSAKEDYEQLRESLKQFDVVAMLAREMRKTQIEESFVRKLVRSVRHLQPDARAASIVSLADNLDVLSPIFPLVMQVFSSLAPNLDEPSRAKMLSSVKSLFVIKSHILNVPVNQAHAIRVLGLALDEESEQILHRIYQQTSSIGVKRDVIIAMANRDLAWFVSDRRRNYLNLSSWERRAVLASSYILEDEGDHWRKKLILGGFESIIAAWASKNKATNNGVIKIPL